MVRIERILAPTDFSTVSLAAIRYALSLARTHAAEVVVVHAVSEKALEPSPYAHFVGEEVFFFPPDWIAGLRFPVLDGVVERRRQQLDNFLRERIEPELLRDLEVTPLVKLGETVKEIVWTAKERRCDLIVMTSRGRSWFKQLFSKSLTQQVVKLAPCPVLSIQPSAQVRTGKGEWVPIGLLERGYAVP